MQAPDTDPELTGYWDDGQRKTTTSPAGGVTTWSYDRANREVRVANPLGGITTKTYWPDGQLKQTIDPEGHATVYGNDTADLCDSALEDLLGAGEQTGQTWARLSSNNAGYDFLYDLLAFDSVTAHVGPEDTVPSEPPPWLTIDSR